MIPKNLFHYLKKYSTTSFDEMPINTIDILIFSRIASFPLEIIPYKFNLTIAEVFEKIEEFEAKRGDFIIPGDYKLFKILAESPRYHNLKLSHFEDVVDKEKELQFAAVLISDGKKSYVSYRGTDENIVGWKEDFNMAFSETIPAQDLAKKYLHKIWLFHPFKKIILLGHSKGGNLATYAAFSSNYFIKKHIEIIYNIDGPGFLKKIQDSKRYREISDKIIKIVPESSVVGRLLNHEEELNVVKSAGAGIMQHDLYLWYVKGTDLIYLDKTSKFSDLVNLTITSWLESLTLEERKKGIDLIYKILSTSDTENVKELIFKLPLKLQEMFKNYKDLSEEDKQFIDFLNSKFKKSVKFKENDKEK